MNKPDQEALDAAARAIWGNVELSAWATIHAMQTGDPELEDNARQMKDQAQTALEILINALGARRPGLRVGRDTLPLEMLNTPATRAYLAALEEAKRAAEAVDQERGWVDSDGECIGFGETLAGMTLGLKREVYGARGRGLE